ncbi:MAG: hypothetical protein QOG75_2245 [Mycobacterium sp.]|jgi:hypothetical protein|nr:hypothetical protein [Mycobacterium sp.]
MVTMPDIEHLGPWIPPPAVLGYGFLPVVGRTPTPSQANQEDYPRRIQHTSLKEVSTYIYSAAYG